MSDIVYELTLTTIEGVPYVGNRRIKAAQLCIYTCSKQADMYGSLVSSILTDAQILPLPLVIHPVLSNPLRDSSLHRTVVYLHHFTCSLP